MTTKTLPHTCGTQIPVAERYNGVQLAMTTPRRCPGCGGQVSYNLLVNLQGKEVIMPEQSLVILDKIQKARIRIELANRQNADGTTLSAMSWLADALEDIVMTMQANELKEADNRGLDLAAELAQPPGQSPEYF